MKKKVFYTELAYVCGIIILSLGAACMEAADFGLSMVVAPAYLLHLKVSESLPFFTFGMAEYIFQALLIVLLAAALKKFRLSYLFSFITAVFYGISLDAFIALLSALPQDTLVMRVLFFALGIIFCAVGVSLVFHTYIAPEAYELVVKELSEKFGFDINRCKTVYDCVSCLISIVMSFAFFGFGRFEGVKAGTIFCAFINGSLIGKCTEIFEKHFEFKDGSKLRKFFENI